VLEEQVLGHRGSLLASRAAPVVALHLVSGTDCSFSTSSAVLARCRSPGVSFSHA
jgi:hypothetical protein